jgi:GLPGLI family protein
MNLFRVARFSALFFFIAYSNLSSQSGSGIVKFKHTVFFEFENMPADMPKSSESFTRLVFNGPESIYEKDPDIKIEVNENDNTPRMFRRMRERSNKTTYKNLEKSIALENLNLFGKDFLITDSIENFKWKVSAGEQKIIAGYTCMKASYKDSLSNIVVFFTPQIPKKFGPDKFGNLPGIILEVQSAQTHIIATEIKLEATEIKVPTKGDKMTRKEFEKLREEKTKEMRQMWGQRGSETRVIRQ